MYTYKPIECEKNTRFHLQWFVNTSYISMNFKHRTNHCQHFKTDLEWIIHCNFICHRNFSERRAFNISNPLYPKLYVSLFNHCNPFQTMTGIVVQNDSVLNVWYLWSEWPYAQWLISVVRETIHSMAASMVKMTMHSVAYICGQNYIMLNGWYLWSE